MKGRSQPPLKLIERDKRNLYNWERKGHYLVKLGRYEEALAALDHATDNNKNYKYMWMSKGDVLKAMERDEEAEEAYKKGAGQRNEFSPPYFIKLKKWREERR